MNNINPSRMTPAEVEALARRDKRRVLLFTVAAAALVVGYFLTRWSGQKAAERAEAEGPALGSQAEQTPLVVMEFDRPELLEAVSDGTPEARLTLAGEALTALLYYSNVLTERHYDTLDTREVDAGVVEELGGDPAPARGEPFRVRGEIEVLGKRRRTANLEESYATLKLPDGARAHVAFVKPVDENDDPLVVGDFARLNGLFLQRWRGNVKGELIDAPLFVGRTLVRSYPEREPLAHEELRTLLIAEVVDDQLNDVREIPHELLWELMAFAADRADEIDWEEVSELDNQMLMNLPQSGPAFRAMPFRIPVSVNLGSWTEDAGENRLRLERITRGWIGNTIWKGLIQWVGPFGAPHLEDRYGEASKLTARGFFLKNVFYERKTGEPGRAALFVMTGVEPFIPPYDPRPRQLMVAVFTGTMLTVALIWYLLRRDRRASAQLHEELVRRRRARRTRGGPDTVAPENSPG